MSRRTCIRSVIFLSALFLVLGGLALKNYTQAQAYRRQLTNSYQHAFAELNAHLEGMDAALQKGQYASSPAMLSALCAEVYCRSAAAQMALGELPWSHVKLEQTSAFLAKAGDYAWSLSKTSLTDGLTEDTRKNLAELASASADLSRRVYTLQEELNSQDLSPETLAQAEEELSSQDSGQVQAGSAFQSVEEEFPEVPSLIYDGPFSEHLSARTPKYLEGKDDVDETSARRSAAAFLEVPEEDLEQVSVGEGSLPTYGFSMEDEDKSLYLEVTRQGGVVLELLTDRRVGASQLLPESALAIARDFLLEHGYTDMAETYHIRQGNLFTINYAYRQGDVLCYPDLIKVTVALDTGEIHTFEAKGYVMHHTQRQLAAPTISREQAQATLSPTLTVLSHQLAAIPTLGEYELFCHEFLGQTEDGRHILVYINAKNGHEEKILLLQEDENGTLVK